MTILTRVAAFLAGYAVIMGALYALPLPSGDAPIGLGLLAFGVAVLVAAAWGFHDGRQMSLGRLAVTWCVVGLAIGTAVPLTVAIVEGADAGQALADLVGSVPFLMGLVAGPAVVAGLIGSSLQPPSPAGYQPRHH